VRAGDLVIARLAKVRSGHYRLKVPAGRYWLFAATTRFRGKAGIDRPVGKVIRVRKGKRKNVPVSLRKRRQHAHAAQISFVQVKHPAVWVQHFSVSGPEEVRVLRKGLADMLITDVMPRLRAACNGRFVEREKLNLILEEQALSQSRFVDPATRIEPNKIIGHNKEVTGTISGTANDMTITTTVTDVRSGTSRSVTHHGTDGFFALQPKLVPDLVRLICGDKPPSRLVGTVKGQYGIPEQMLKWSGNVRLKYNGLGPGGPGAPDGKYATYVIEDGSLHVTLDGVHDECTIHGEGDFALTGNLGEFATLQQDVDERAYTLAASFTNGTNLPYTSTGPDCVGAVYPLSGRVYMTTNSAKLSRSDSLIGSSTVNVGVPVSWDWALEPQY
jgi:hypothetical protein